MVEASHQGQKPQARPDIVSRVFKLKVEELVFVLKKGTYFGKAQAAYKEEVVRYFSYQVMVMPH
ncbi:hypothetical protein E2562_005631 [Oryza meyeriana var. granulata]|uniref:Uncharacterized protein n=1 Tax=Oryza meyeriana var. granulata TaxID=110450 RepID=A0A6G1BJ13_9ORYZ|nr:hypothetical protein E2562_005631 [Oryza meyeriana var. granulata]